MLRLKLYVVVGLTEAKPNKLGLLQISSQIKLDKPFSTRLVTLPVKHVEFQVCQTQSKLYGGLDSYCWFKNNRLKSSCVNCPWIKKKLFRRTTKFHFDWFSSWNGWVYSDYRHVGSQSRSYFSAIISCHNVSVQLNHKNKESNDFILNLKKGKFKKLSLGIEFEHKVQVLGDFRKIHKPKFSPMHLQTRSNQALTPTLTSKQLMGIERN